MVTCRLVVCCIGISLISGELLIVSLAKFIVFSMIGMEFLSFLGSVRILCILRVLVCWSCHILLGFSLHLHLVSIFS